jgi:hypothetical protein
MASPIGPRPGQRHGWVKLAVLGGPLSLPSLSVGSTPSACGVFNTFQAALRQSGALTEQPRISPSACWACPKSTMGAKCFGRSFRERQGDQDTRLSADPS